MPPLRPIHCLLPRKEMILSQRDKNWTGWPVSRTSKARESNGTERGEADTFVSIYDDLVSTLRRERPDMDMLGVRFMVSLSEAGRWIDTAFAQLCEDNFDLRAADAKILITLRRAGRPYAMRPTDLLNALLVTSGAITKQVDRLVAKGLCERLPDPLRCGGFLIHLSRAGLNTANDIFDAINNDFFPIKLLEKFDTTFRDNGIVFVEEILNLLYQKANLRD